VVAAEQCDVPHGSQALSAAAVISQLVGNPHRRIGEALRLSQIHSCDANNPFVQGVDDGGIPQLGPTPEERHQRATARLRNKLIEHRARRLHGRLHAQNPIACSVFLRRCRQRPRMKPTDPVARPSRRATSRYGSGGSA